MELPRVKALHVCMHTKQQDMKNKQKKNQPTTTKTKKPYQFIDNIIFYYQSRILHLNNDTKINKQKKYMYF